MKILFHGLPLREFREELALSMEGKKRKFRRKDFINFGNGLGLTGKQVEGAFSRMNKNRKLADQWIEKSFLSDPIKRAYLEGLDARYNQLEIK